MGMAFEYISVYGANPPFQTLMSEGVLNSPMFCFNLAPSGSLLFLGDVYPGYTESDFTWLPLYDVQLQGEVCQIFKCV
jgi:Eukaryotic aspartyl protease